MNSCIVAKEFLTKSLLNVELPSLRRTAGEIIDIVVREVIYDFRIIFEEETSDVTS